MLIHLLRFTMFTFFIETHEHVAVNEKKREIAVRNTISVVNSAHGEKEYAETELPTIRENWAANRPSQ